MVTRLPKRIKEQRKIQRQNARIQLQRQELNRQIKVREIQMFEEKFNVPDQPFVRRILGQGPFRF